MRRAVIFAITIIFAVALLARASSYTVRFTETAVLTTFGSASTESVQTKPGLKFKWPDPIQSVTKYDNRTRFLHTPDVTQQTLDERQLVIKSFCTWRVADPLLFFQKFSNAGDRAASHYQEAERLIRGNLRSAMGEISRYRLSDLFTQGGRQSRLPELEQQILTALVGQTSDGHNLADYGVEITAVGINRIVLPEDTTAAVMDSMKQDRQRLVSDLESRGQAQRQAIVTAAKSHAEKIRAFAEAYAAEIRRQGDMEAEQYIAQMNESPELAVFLKNIEFMKTAMAKRITYVVNGGIPGFELFFPTPGERRGLGVSRLLGPDLGREQAEQEDEPAARIASQRREPTEPRTESTPGERR